jgi:hypothetical protein
VQTGFGSFVTVYLVKNHWPPDAIGFALTIATLRSLFSQIPAGAALDSMRDKRRAVADRDAKRQMERALKERR